MKIRLEDNSLTLNIENFSETFKVGGGIAIIAWIIIGANDCTKEPTVQVNLETHEPNSEEVVVDQELEVDGPARFGSGRWAHLEVVDPIVVNEEAVVEPSQPVIIQNTDSLQVENQEIHDLPTFDEALEMEIVKTDNSEIEVTKHRQKDECPSIKTDELPDYETHESHPVYF